MRLKGRFSIATVDWVLIGQSSNLVVQPHNGTLTFQLDQPSQTIYIEITGARVCHQSISIVFHMFICKAFKHILNMYVDCLIHCQHVANCMLLCSTSVVAFLFFFFKFYFVRMQLSFLYWLIIITCKIVMKTMCISARINFLVGPTKTLAWVYNNSTVYQLYCTNVQ